MERRCAPMSGPQQLLALMQEEARFRHRACISTGSEVKQAEKLGVSRQSIRRWKCQLSEAGAIKRDGYFTWDRKTKDGFPIRTVRWRILKPRVTQGTSYQRTNSSRAG